MRINDPSKKLDINGLYFAQVRDELNAVLNGAVTEILTKGFSGAAITLKIGLGIIKLTENDANAPTGVREALLPEIKYKLNCVLQTKDERSGAIVKPMTRELVQDDTKAYYLLSADEASGQLNMFNGYDELPQPDEDDLFEEREGGEA